MVVVVQGVVTHVGEETDGKGAVVQDVGKKIDTAAVQVSKRVLKEKLCAVG